MDNLRDKVIAFFTKAQEKFDYFFDIAWGFVKSLWDWVKSKLF